MKYETATGPVALTKKLETYTILIAAALLFILTKSGTKKIS